MSKRIIMDIPGLNTSPRKALTETLDRAKTTIDQLVDARKKVLDSYEDIVTDYLEEAAKHGIHIAKTYPDSMINFFQLDFLNSESVLGMDAINENGERTRMKAVSYFDFQGTDQWFYKVCLVFQGFDEEDSEDDPNENEESNEISFFNIMLVRIDMETSKMMIADSNFDWYDFRGLVDENYMDEDMEGKTLEEAYPYATDKQKVILYRDMDDPERSLLEILLSKNDGKLSDEEYEKSLTKYMHMLLMASSSDMWPYFVDTKEGILLRGSDNAPGVAVKYEDGKWEIYQYLDELDIEMNYGVSGKAYLRHVGTTEDEEYIRWLLSPDADIDDFMMLEVPLSSHYAFILACEEANIVTIRDAAREQLEGRDELTPEEQENLDAFCSWFRRNTGG